MCAARREFLQLLFPKYMILVRNFSPAINFRVATSANAAEATQSHARHLIESLFRELPYRKGSIGSCHTRIFLINHVILFLTPRFHIFHKRFPPKPVRNRLFLSHRSRFSPNFAELSRKTHPSLSSRKIEDPDQRFTAHRDLVKRNLSFTTVSIVQSQFCRT